MGVLGLNPVKKVKTIRYERPEFMIWSAPQIKLFLEAAEKHSPLFALYQTALTTGLRPGELIALQWSDVHGEYLHVKRTATVVKNKYHFGPPKTKHGNRLVPLFKDTRKVLEGHAEELGTLRHTSPFVFPTRNGTHWLHGNINRNLKAVAKRAQVPKIRAHDLRHSFVSMCIAKGMDIVRLSRLIGHGNPAFTLQRYAHLFDRLNQRTSLTLGELMGDDDEDDPGVPVKS